MKKKKLLGALAGAALAALLMAGCSGSADSSSTEASEGDTTKLVFWCHENEAWNVAYEDMAAKFEAAHPEYDVEVVSYPFGENVDKMQTALSADEGEVDVMAVWGGMAPSFI